MVSRPRRWALRMSQASFLKCSCAHCGGHIEFPVEGAGLSISCPHCAQNTELTVELPAAASAPRKSSSKWILAGIIILVAGLAGGAGALVMAQRLAAKSKPRQNEPRQGFNAKSDTPARAGAPATPHRGDNSPFDGFSASEVKIESKAGSTLVYAVGTVKNETDKPRFGVTVELGLFDAAGQRLGGARDYKDSMEPRSEWSFRALLVQKHVAAARVSAIREQP